jgi:hypothetical protein
MRRMWVGAFLEFCKRNLNLFFNFMFYSFLPAFKIDSRSLRWFPVNLVFEMVFFLGHLLEDRKRERRRRGEFGAREVITV